MGVSYSALLGLGAVGAEYREPLGLICDFLVGREGGPEIPPVIPTPLPPPLLRRADLSRANAVSQGFRLTIESWGQGP